MQIAQLGALRLIVTIVFRSSGEKANSELLRVAYCDGGRYVTCMIIPVFSVIARSGPCVRLRW